MNIRVFVSGSAVLLSAWLLATFVQKVPTASYRTNGKAAVTQPAAETTTQTAAPQTSMTANR